MSPNSLSRAVRELAIETLAACWCEVGLPSEALEGILEPVWSSASWPEATLLAREKLGKADLPVDAYRFARGRKFDSFSRIIQPYVIGQVLDVGAGGPDLLERLAADTRTCTDIMKSDREVAGISHVIQEFPFALPFEDESFDTVLMTGMAHHLNESDRGRLLRDISRCLRHDGRIVMIEETFSESAGCGNSREKNMKVLGTTFDRLARADRFAFLCFTDWWGNRVMKASDSIPLPMTFLDLEQWKSELTLAGLSVIRAEQLGLMSGGGHQATPRALIVATRQ